MKLDEHRLYIPPLNYPQFRRFGSNEIYSHPPDALPETVRVLRGYPGYINVGIGRSSLSSVLPLVSTGFFYCKALITRGSWVHPSRSISHIVNSYPPNDHVDWMRHEFALRGASNQEALLIMCPGYPESKDEFVDQCRAAGLKIHDVLLISSDDESRAPQTDVITNPFTKKTHIITEERERLVIDF